MDWWDFLYILEVILESIKNFLGLILTWCRWEKSIWWSRVHHVGQLKGYLIKMRFEIWWFLRLPAEHLNKTIQRSSLGWRAFPRSGQNTSTSRYAEMRMWSGEHGWTLQLLQCSCCSRVRQPHVNNYWNNFPRRTCDGGALRRWPRPGLQLVSIQFLWVIFQDLQDVLEQVFPNVQNHNRC